ncbi:hypothetical protein [Brevibacterium sp. XM4083]|uniref:hypothetical protein n=1 Tax=Brevibacterium sp. XM4083 TaxID=2583238 RepID=UPI0015E7FAC9|nr:hypothetical protein [Brevibacterium sp. XM4083]MCM1013459.1 hypothetical protein [Brevibacterium sp. XM4083]
MSPMLTAPRMRAVVAASVLALSLGLTGCGAGGEKDAPADDTPSSADPSAAESTAPSSSEAGSSEEASTEGAPSEDPFADSARAQSWASDEGMDIDADGNGTIPAASLEADLVDLFRNKFDLEVEEATCDTDMEVTAWSGFEPCDVVVKDMTYFGTVELIDHKDAMVKYEVLFPGLNKDDVSF